MRPREIALQRRLVRDAELLHAGLDRAGLAFHCVLHRLVAADVDVVAREAASITSSSTSSRNAKVGSSPQL